MKKSLAIILVALMAAMLTGCSSSNSIVFSTGGTTGVYYIFGGEIASLWMGKIEGLNVTVESSGGSKDNVRALYTNEADIAWVQNDVISYAYGGDAFFDYTVADNFSAIGAVYPEMVQLVVARDSGITSVADLAGRHVSVGPAGSGHYFNALQILDLYGLQIGDVRPQYLSNTEVIDAFQNKQIDAFFLTAAYPHATVTDVAMKRDIDVISFTADDIAALQARYPFYQPVTIPAGTYQGVEEDKLVPAVSAVLVARNGLSEDVVYQLTGALFEHYEELTNAKKAYISVENAVLGIPVTAGDAARGVSCGSFHPGALKYYKEIGLIKD